MCPLKLQANKRHVINFVRFYYLLFMFVEHAFHKPKDNLKNTRDLRSVDKDNVKYMQSSQTDNFNKFSPISAYLSF